MKTRIIIEVESKENIKVLPEEGTSAKDYTKEELVMFRKDFAKDVNGKLVALITDFVVNKKRTCSMLEDQFLDDEFYVEGLDKLSDYAKVRVVKE
jgi:hypothetical protein